MQPPAPYEKRSSWCAPAWSSTSLARDPQETWAASQRQCRRGSEVLNFQSEIIELVRQQPLMWEALNGDPGALDE